MPKLKGPLFSVDARGALGKKIIFTRGGYARNYFTPRNPNTPAQQVVREAFKEFSMPGLTQEQADLLYAAIAHLHDDYLSIGDYFPRMIPSGRYIYSGNILSPAALVSVSGDDLHVAYTLMSREVQCTEIVLHTGAPAAARKIRLGFYADDNFYPGALMYELDEIDVSSAGFYSISVDLSFPKGLVWTAYLCDGDCPVSRVLPTSFGRYSIWGLRTPQQGNTVGYRSAMTYDTLPTNFPTGVTVESQGVAGFYMRLFY
jgi:hypothetical protein